MSSSKYRWIERVHLGRLAASSAYVPFAEAAARAAHLIVASSSSVTSAVHEVALVAVHDHLADVRAGRLELALDRLRRDVLAARGLDQVLLAVGDAQEAVGVELADVAGAEPAVGVERLGGRVGQVVVAAA